MVRENASAPIEAQTIGPLFWPSTFHHGDARDATTYQDAA
jgi:hypothetical protein